MYETREMAPFGGLSLALRGWEVFQKQTDRCSDTKTDVQTNIQMFGHTDGQTNRWTPKMCVCTNPIYSIISQWILKLSTNLESSCYGGCFKTTWMCIQQETKVGERFLCVRTHRRTDRQTDGHRHPEIII